MGVSREFEAFVVDLFTDLGPVRLKRMFGGALAYAGDEGFALLDADGIYIKADDFNEAAFLDADCAKFSYPLKDGRIAELPYRRMPEAALDDPEEAVRWARLGVEAARRKASSAKPKVPRAARKK